STRAEWPPEHRFRAHGLIQSATDPREVNSPFSSSSGRPPGIPHRPAILACIEPLRTERCAALCTQHCALCTPHGALSTYPCLAPIARRRFPSAVVTALAAGSRQAAAQL